MRRGTNTRSQVHSQVCVQLVPTDEAAGGLRLRFAPFPRSESHHPHILRLFFPATYPPRLRHVRHGWRRRRDLHLGRREQEAAQPDGAVSLLGRLHVLLSERRDAGSCIFLCIRAGACLDNSPKRTVRHMPSRGASVRLHSRALSCHSPHAAHSPLGFPARYARWLAD